MQRQEYLSYDGLGLAALCRTGQVSAQEIVTAAIDVIDQINPQINAVIHTLYDTALAAAKKPLDGLFIGVPFLVKDIIAAIANVPTTAACRYLQHCVYPEDSELIKRYRRAGLIILGKTNLPEFALGATTEPAWFGATRNPWQQQHSVGGSSGGSAAAVAAGMVPLAHGGDGGGSIRIPAACCGVFGLKPSRGRTPSGPYFGRIWQGSVVEHGLSRSVRDSAALLDISCGRDLGAPFDCPKPTGSFLEATHRSPGKLKIAYLAEPIFPAQQHPDCVHAAREAAQCCESLGHQVESVTLDLGEPLELVIYHFIVMVAAEINGALRLYQHAIGRPYRRAEIDLSVRTMDLLGRKLNAGDYMLACQTMDRLGRRMARFMLDYDIILTPTLAEPPKLLGELLPSRWEHLAMQLLQCLPFKPLINASVATLAAKIFDYIPNLPLFNLTGQPAMSVPLSSNAAGLPIGVQFAAGFGEEARLLSLAAQLEQAFPWAKRYAQLATLAQ